MRPIPGFVPLVILGAAAAQLGVRYDEIPTQWISHWGPGGVPNGWSTKTTAGVFGPLLIALLPLGLTEAIAFVLRRSGEADAEPARVATVSMMRWIMIAVTASIAIVAVRLPFGIAEPNTLAYECAAMLLLAVVAGLGPVIRASKVVAEKRGVRLVHGLFYDDPRDRRLWVPKLAGVGYTVNVGHPLGWVVLIALIVLPLLFVGVMIALTAR